MKYFSLFALMALMMASCANQPKQTAEEAARQDGVIKVPMPMATGYVDFDTLYNVEKVIVPERTEQTAFSRPTRVFCTDSLMIIFVRKSQQIMSFDLDGKFRNFIGKQGNKDNEYGELDDVVIYQDTVYAYDKNEKKMFVYLTNGNLVRVIQSDFEFRSFAKAEDGFWLYACHKSKNPQGNALVRVDEDMKNIVDGHFPQCPDFINLEHGANFVIHNTKAFFYWPTSNIIYLLYGDEVLPQFTVDFGDRTPAYGFLARQTEIRAYESYMEDNKLYRFRNVHICGDFITLVYRRYAVSDVVQTNFAFYNRATGTCVASPIKYASVNRLLQSSFNVGETDNNMILYANIANDEAAKKFTLENYGIEVGNESNPLIILCKPMLH